MASVTRATPPATAPRAAAGTGTRVGCRTFMASVVVVCVAALGAPVPSLAQDAEARIADGRQRYADLDYEGAAEVLEGALDLASLPPAAEARALETLGFSYVVLERLRDARRAFERLFAIDPYYDVREPTGSPRVEEFVEDVRREVAPDAALDSDVDVRVELPRGARAGATVTVRVRTNGGSVRSVALLVRSATDGDWTRVDARRMEGGFEADVTLGTSTEDDGDLELYAEARDGRGRLLARAASPLAPLHLDVRPATDAPGPSEPGGENLAEAWWLWTIVGVAVVGIGVGVGVGVATSSSSGPSVVRAPDGTLPPFRVELP